MTVAMLVGLLARSAGGGSRPWSGPDPALWSDEGHTAQATHAMRGIVKSVGPSRLVIAASGPAHRDVTFVLTSSTLREGVLEVGAVVSVRYLVEGTMLVVTAVVVRVHPSARGVAAAADDAVALSHVLDAEASRRSSRRCS
jgi:hypothetical protein